MIDKNEVALRRARAGMRRRDAADQLRAHEDQRLEPGGVPIAWTGLLHLDGLAWPSALSDYALLGRRRRSEDPRARRRRRSSSSRSSRWRPLATLAGVSAAFQGKAPQVPTAAAITIEDFVNKTNDNAGSRRRAARAKRATGRCATRWARDELVHGQPRRVHFFVGDSAAREMQLGPPSTRAASPRTAAVARAG